MHIFRSSGCVILRPGSPGISWPVCSIQAKATSPVSFLNQKGPVCLRSPPLPLGCLSKQKQNAAHTLRAACPSPPPPGLTAPHCWHLLLYSLSLVGFQVKPSPAHPDAHSHSWVCSLPETVTDFQEGSSLRTPLWSHCNQACQLSHSPHFITCRWKGFLFFSFLFWSLRCLILLHPLRENSHDLLTNLWCLSASKMWTRRLCWAGLLCLFVSVLLSASR